MCDQVKLDLWPICMAHIDDNNDDGDGGSGDASHFLIENHFTIKLT